MVEIEISIELIMVGILILIFILWFFWYMITSIRARKKYKKLNDGKDKQEGGFRGSGINQSARGEQKFEIKTPNVPRPAELAERELPMATTPVDPGKTSSSTRKTGRSSRNFFTRIKRK